jgi:antitoxin VapB
MLSTLRVENVGTNLKNKETYRLARQLAKLTGESLTTAITQAVRERLDRLRRERDVYVERLLQIGRDCAAHLKEPFRTIDHEHMLYDDRGLPK